MKKLKIIFFLILVIAIHQSCQSDETVEETPEKNCNVSYENDIAPLTKTSCFGYCHHAADYSSSYENIKIAVDNGKLWQNVVIEKTMPQYPNTITEEEREIFACWIEAGAPNN